MLIDLGNGDVNQGYTAETSISSGSDAVKRCAQTSVSNEESDLNAEDRKGGRERSRGQG